MSKFPSKNLFDNGCHPICIVDPQGNILHANDAFTKIFDLQRDTQSKHSFIELAHLSDRDHIRDQLLIKTVTETPTTYQNCFFTLKSQYEWYEWSILLKTEQDEIYIVLKNIDRDKQQLELLQATMEASRDGMVISDARKNDKPIIYASKSFLELTGYSESEVLNRNCRFLQGPKTDQTTIEKIRKSLKDESVFTGEILNYKKNGEFFWNLLRISPIYNTEGELTHFVGSQTDITALKEAENTTIEFGHILETSLNEIYLIDLQTLQITEANLGARNNLGYTEPEIQKLQYTDIQPNCQKTQCSEKIASLQKGEELNINYDTYNKRKDGSFYPVEVSLQVANIKNKSVLVAIMLDISERKKNQETQRTQAQVFANLYDAVIITNLEGQITDWNKSAERMFGLARDQVISKKSEDLPQLSGILDNRPSHFTIQQKSDQFNRNRLSYNRPDGEKRSCDTSTTVLKDDNGQPTGVLQVIRDITEEQNLAKQLIHQASHDSLTNLINRRQFEKHLEQLLESAHHYRHEHALCYLDLDQFKVINDTSGHIAGDELLRQLSGLLLKKIRKQDILARLGGDEFGILIHQCSIQHASRVANIICETISDFKFQWQDKSYSIGVSIGLVPINENSGSLSDILSQADSACYAAKDEGRNRIHIYHSEDMELEKRFGEMQWATRLKHALEENRFRLFAQPIISTNGSTNSCSYELLLRMLDKNNELIAPTTFFPAAERYALSSDLDTWTIQYLFNKLAANPKHFSDADMYFINLSGQSLGNQRFLDGLVSTFHKTKIPADKICFEITETAAIINLTHAVHFIETLRQLGFRFALDDFGSGFSSFAYLKNLQVDFIKIDGFFVKGIAHDLINKAMVRSINDIGHVMGKKTIAECVESNDIAEALKEMKVDYMQGFALGKPQLLE